MFLVPVVGRLISLPTMHAGVLFIHEGLVCISYDTKDAKKKKTSHLSTGTAPRAARSLQKGDEGRFRCGVVLLDYLSGNVGQLIHEEPR